MSATIHIPIPDPLARVYESASEEDKRKAQWLVELVLHNLFLTQTESLNDVVRDISQKAAARGLTPEILEQLLNDDE